jgi:hypothetical protein
MSLARVELDYLVPARRPWQLGLVVFLMSLATAGLLVERYRQLQFEIARIEAARGMTAVRAPARKSLDVELKAAEAVARQLALPWSAMVRAVEAAAIPEIAVLQLQPEARDRQLRLTAEAKTEAAMLDYLRHLAGTQALSEVRLATHQVMIEDPQRPIQFTVLARLKESR